MLYKGFRIFQFLIKTRFESLKCFASVAKSRSALFFEPRVQSLLKTITATDLETTFPVIKIGQRLKPPEYKFMTDDELKKAVGDATIRAEKWKQIPPVLDARSDDPIIISEDPGLDGFDVDKSTYVFTDITYGIEDRERLIAVREPSGTLKTATLSQRHRMTETYCPRPGRELHTPAMFNSDHLESLLDRKEYVFILDRACAQFEPDDSDYIRVTSETYNRIARERHFQYIRGTRHYGALVFYLMFNKEVDAVLLDNIQSDRLEDAVSMVELYHVIHPESQSTSTPNNDHIELLKSFIEKNAGRKNVMELALQSLVARLEEKRNQVDEVERTHGVTT